MTNGSQGSGPKRPHATIEGKATEVKPEPAKTAPPAGATATSDQRAAAERVATAGASVAADAKKAEAAKSAANASLPRRLPPSRSPRRAPVGFGSMVSHTLAGVIGGALALLAYPLLSV